MDRRKFLCKAFSYAENQFGDKITVADMAKASGYSVPQFSRLFTEFSGITPIRYLNMLRILKSADMLLQGKKSVTDIAFECGFESLEVFERNFKKYFGVSAAEYRCFGLSAPSPFYLSEKIYYERLRSMTIDGGNFFDWGRVSKLYSKSRNIYPEDFWNALNSLGVGQNGQEILDIGTGTGILPLNMQKFGGKYAAVDKSPEMILQAKDLVPDINFICADAHNMPFENGSFDIITALQCWVYFDKKRLFPELDRLLKSDGKLYIMFMTWLPEEDEIIRKSFGIIKKYNSEWSGYMKRFDIAEFNLYNGNFTVESVVKKDYDLPFTRESWCDRLTASRGVGAALPEEKIKKFRTDLMDMLEKSVEDKFTLLHEAVIIKLKKVK